MLRDQLTRIFRDRRFRKSDLFCLILVVVALARNEPVLKYLTACSLP